MQLQGRAVHSYRLDPTGTDLPELPRGLERALGGHALCFTADVHVRGNHITLTGEPGEIALAERLLDELVTIISTGQGVTVETV